MFSGCSGLTRVDVSGFKTDNVKIMQGMFSNCSGLKCLDVSSWNTSNVLNMGNMFKNCSGLTTIYVNEKNWNTEKVSDENGEDMFSGCTKLVGGNGTKYDASHTGVEYARIDKVDTPGYLTAVSNDIEPVDNGNLDFGGSDSAIDENTDLDGNVIGNIYYNIAPGNGGYNAMEGCIEVTKPTSDDDMDELEGKDVFGEDFRKHFTGIVFKVPAGQGSITVNGETTGGMMLKVKIGNQEPLELMLIGKMKMKIPYNVSKATYIYIYAGEMDADASRSLAKAAATPSLKIYGIEVKQDSGTPTGVGEAPLLNDNGENDSYYDLQGRRIQAQPKRKGVYVRQGRKVVVR